MLLRFRKQEKNDSKREIGGYAAPLSALSWMATRRSSIFAAKMSTVMTACSRSNFIRISSTLWPSFSPRRRVPTRSNSTSNFLSRLLPKKFTDGFSTAQRDSMNLVLIMKLPSTTPERQLALLYRDKAPIRPGRVSRCDEDLRRHRSGTTSTARQWRRRGLLVPASKTGS
jgi:hypothetical protein